MNNIFNTSKIKSICYHGTDSSPFTELDKSKIQVNPDEGEPGYFGWGFYLTTDLEYAKTYGDTVLAFYVNIQHPFPFDEVNYMDMLNFLFEDSNKQLFKHLHSTMYFFRLVGENKELEFENQNSSSLKERCLDIYKKYKDVDSFDDDQLQELKTLMAELAKHINNWLNGLFMHFGRELFHYITLNGFDGIIANGGKEVVVYETEQIVPVEESKIEPEPEEEPVEEPEEVTEDITPVEVTPTDYKAGSKEFMQTNLIDFFKSHSDITDYEIYQDMYPTRDYAIWYYDTLFGFTINDTIRIIVYESPDGCVVLKEGTKCYDAYDLESNGIYTDTELNDEVDEDIGWDNDGSSYGFYCEILDDNGQTIHTLDWFDLNCDTFWTLSQFFPLDWLYEMAKRDIPEHIWERYGAHEDRLVVDQLIKKGFIKVGQNNELNPISEDLQMTAVSMPPLPEGYTQLNWNSQFEILKDYIEYSSNVDNYNGNADRHVEPCPWNQREHLRAIENKRKLALASGESSEYVLVLEDRTEDFTEVTRGSRTYWVNSITLNWHREHGLNAAYIIGETKTMYAVQVLKVNRTLTDWNAVSDAYIWIDEDTRNKLLAVNEDLQPQTTDGTYWRDGQAEYRNELAHRFDAYRDVISDLEIGGVYPERKNPIWYDEGKTIFSFVYKDCLYIEARVNTSGEVYVDNENDTCDCAEDLEERGIFTDEELCAATEGDPDAWDTYGYIDIFISTIGAANIPGNNTSSRYIEDLYDLNYEFCYDIEDCFGNGSVDWIFDELISDYCTEFLNVNEQVANWAVNHGLLTKEQFDRVYGGEEVDEDLTMQPIDRDSWDTDHGETMRKIENYFRSNPDITKWKIKQYISKERQDPVWFDYDNIWEFWYKKYIHVVLYCYKEGDIELGYYDDDGEWVWDTVDNAVDLERHSIFTDRHLYDYINDNHCDSAWDNCYNEHNFRIEVLDENRNVIDTVYSFDMNYDPTEELSADELKWEVEEMLPDVFEAADEYFNDRAVERLKELGLVHTSTEEQGETHVREGFALKEEKKLTKQQLLSDLINTFGKIDLKKYNESDALYLLRDGSLLDTKGIYDNHQHENISKYIEDKYKIKDSLNDGGSKFMNSIGAIRVTPWIPGIVVPHVKLTADQEDTLFSIIKLLSTKINKDHPLMITSEDGSQFIEYSKVKNPEEIITAILGYQILGILKEQLAPGKEFKFLNHLK